MADDMIGSPNAGYFRYASSTTGRARRPAGSAVIERTLRSALSAAGVRARDIDLGGASDHASFVAAGIPVGGIFTGAQEAKSAAEATTWGGTAGASHDPCYHQSCDTVDNIDDTTLDRNADAIAAAVWTLSGAGSPLHR